MPVRIELNKEEQAKIKEATGQTIDHINVADRVIISLTEDQQKRIEEETGQTVKELELSEFDLEKMSTAAWYENGRTVSVKNDN